MSIAGLSFNRRLTESILTAAAVAGCGVAAALTAVGIAEQSKLLMLLPAAFCALAILAIVAITRFATFVLLMLLTRASLDVTKLTGADTPSSLLSPSNLIGVLFIIAASLWLVATYHKQGRLPGSALRTGLAALGCAALLSVPGAVDPKTSVGEVLRLLAIVLMYAVLEQLLVDPKMMRRALVAVFCSAIFPLLYTGGGFLLGNPAVQIKGGVTRVLGTFVQSNAFGIYLMLLITVGVAVLPHLHGRVRVGLAVLLAACTVCLVLTYTLAALFGAFVGVAVVGVKQSKRLLVGLVLVVVAALGFAPALSGRLAEITNSTTYAAASPNGGNSLAWRLQYWSQIVHLADRNPVTGIGYGMTSLITQEAKQPHNDYLRAYVETGLIGLAVYLVVIVLLINLGLRAVREAEPGTLESSIAVGYLGCAVAIALTSAARNTISGVVELWYFVAFAAAASAVRRRAAGAKPGGNGRSSGQEIVASHVAGPAKEKGDNLIRPTYM